NEGQIHPRHRLFGQTGELAAWPRPCHPPTVSTLTEIEAAAAKLSRREQLQLRAFLNKRLEAVVKTKAKDDDPLAGLKEHWRRIDEMTGGKPVLTQKEWKRLAKAIRGE